MTQKARTVILALVFVIALFILLQKTQSNMGLSPSQNETISNEFPSAPQIIDPNQQTQYQQTPATIERAQKMAKIILQEKQIGMIGMELPKEGDYSILNIDLKINPGCNPGDADAIAMELNAAPTHKLLATVEGMNTKDQNFSWEIPKDFLSTGKAEHQFKIKTGEEPIQFGFYLCTANSNDKTCQDKEVTDMNVIFTEHLTKAERLGEKTRVIFYQYLLMDTNGLSVFEEPPKGDQKISELKKYAQERKFQGDKVEQGIDRAKKELQTLLSMPIKLGKDKIKLELPKYDAAACARVTPGGNR